MATGRSKSGLRAETPALQPAIETRRGGFRSCNPRVTVTHYLHSEIEPGVMSCGVYAGSARPTSSSVVVRAARVTQLSCGVLALAHAAPKPLRMIRARVRNRVADLGTRFLLREARPHRLQGRYGREIRLVLPYASATLLAVGQAGCAPRGLAF